MTLRQRVQAALHHQPVDRIPFTPGLFGNEEGQRLRELGAGAWAQVPVVKSTMPQVNLETIECEENGVSYQRTRVRTPVGEVSATWQLHTAYDSSWQIEHYIKGPEDYKVVEFMVRDTVYEPAYDDFPKTAEELGEEGYVTAWFGFSPLLEMQINLLGVERFGEHIFDYPDRFFSLYEALCTKHREAFPLLIRSPAEHVTYCGNCVPEILGRRFQEYCLPIYDELGQHLHENGKLLGCHLDANNAFWAEAVAASAIDVIEAFTPAPDTDMSVADARIAWPNKVLWINFPSSVHLSPPEKVKEVTRQIVREACPGRGFIVGITEDIPEHVGKRSLLAIAEVLAESSLC